MMYTALIDFIDKQDNEYLYHTGDIYPREGYEGSDERIAELSSNANKLGKPVIAKIREPQKQEEPIPAVTPSEITESVTERVEEKPVKRTRGRRKTT